MMRRGSGWAAGRRRRAALAAIVLAVAAPGVALGFGELSQSGSAADCVSDTASGGACQDGRAMANPVAVVISPDGKHLYTANDTSDGVAVFDRDPATGAIAQKPGIAGCITDGGAGGCTFGVGLDLVLDLAISSDGKSVYVAGFNAGTVVVLDRDPVTGALAQKPGTAGCVSASGNAGACAVGKALDLPTRVELSPDGKTLYVAAATSGGGSEAVAVFDRDTTTGAITQKAGTAGCISETGSGGACQDGRGLRGVYGLAVSPDGTSLYSVSFSSHALGVYDRDPATGAIVQKAGADGCVANDAADGCTVGRGLIGGYDVTVSPDGRNVYTTSNSTGTVGIFDRDATGKVAQKAGDAGCISEKPQFAVATCADGRSLGMITGGRLSVAPDGRTVYTAGTQVDTGGVAVLDRATDTGALTQRSGPEGCIAATATDGCTTAAAFALPTDVLAAPGGADVYVTTNGSDSLVHLGRSLVDPPTVTDPGPGPVTTPPADGGATSPPPAASPATTTTPTPPAQAARPKLPVLASLVTLPSTTRCVSRRHFRITIHHPKGGRIRSARVVVNGRRVAVRSGRRVTAPVDLRGLPKGRFTVSVTVTLADGRTVKGTRRYRTCAGRRA